MENEISFWDAYNKITRPVEEETTQIQIDPDQLYLELDIPQTFRTEYNFVKFPFFDLAKDSKREEIKIEETKRTQDGEMKILWWVTRDIKNQFPGDFEKRLHRAIEQIINTLPKPIENPLRIGSLRYIAKLMGINPDSGKNRQDIQQAFDNLVTTSIKAQGTFQLKEDKSRRFLKDTFHLYDRVIYKGEKTPDGSIADCICLMLGSWYLQNINSSYVMPLDWKFYNKLQGPLTTRMYEFLSVYFFVALQNNFKYYDISYSKICAYFPLVRYQTYGEARRQLKKAHTALVEHQYLDNVKWLETAKADDWSIRYYIGPRARDEYKRNGKEILKATERPPITIPERRRLQKSSQKAPEAPESVKKLVDRGITRSTAQRLAKAKPETLIEHKTLVFDWLTETQSHLIKKNPAGYLRKSIEDEYEDPGGYISPEKRKRKQQQQEKLLKRQELQRNIDHYRDQTETQPKTLVYGEMLIWESRYKREHNKPPTTEEREVKQKELIKQLPTKEELQHQLFGRTIENPEELLNET